MVLMLEQMCRDIIQPNFVMAELGCYYGESTEVFAKYAQTVYAIDPWAEDYITGPDLQSVGRDWKETMADVEAMFDAMAADFTQIKKVKKRQENAVTIYSDQSLDLVYCDTLHSEEATASAIDLWLPKLKPGGFMSGHDYVEAFPGVIRAVDTRKNNTFRLWDDGNWAYQI